MQYILRSLTLCELTGDDLNCLDLEYSSFININTPRDLLQARRVVSSL